MRKTIIALIMSAVVVMATSACINRYATPSSDQHVCVFNGSERGGQKLKFQIPPGAESKRIDDDDQVVKIPASNRFYFASSNREVADPGAPNSYAGNANGGIPVTVEGQLRFRFNLERACEWFSKHGRRNAKDNTDLGFNVRGDANQGWFRFLNENFGVTMQEVTSEVVGKYDPYALHYNRPGEGGQPTRLILGRELGVAFTNRIKANLGGDYFCGIDPDPNGADSACPPIRFQVAYAGPGNESPQIQLENARLQAELRKTQQGSLIEAEKQKAELLKAQADTAEQQARIDTAKCRQYAAHGLDCEGHHAPVIYGQQR